MNGLRSIIRTLRAISKRLSRDSVSAYAGQASFFMIISAIPFLLLLISILRTFLPFELNAILDLIYQLLPESAQTLMDQLLSGLQREDSIPLLSISGIALLWASSRGIRSLSDGIRNVYGTRQTTSLLRKYLGALVNTLLIVVVLVSTLALMLFSDGIAGALFPDAGGVFRVLYGIRFLLFLLLLTVAFVLMFYFLADKTMPLRAHFPGALFSSLGWSAFSGCYSYYVSEIARNHHIYGGLSALVLLMLWVYFCMNILLLGAEINVWIRNVQEM